MHHSQLGERNRVCERKSKGFSFTDSQQTRFLAVVQDVSITIADNGPGINEQVRSKLFDPFFTTKPVGKGTGMRLSISYEIIVEKHGGQLSCLSAPEPGAFFAIKIPIQQLLGRNFREL